MPSLIEAGKWQMSINPTLPPLQFVDDKGELQGLNVELAREIAKRICIEPVFLTCAPRYQVDIGTASMSSSRLSVDRSPKSVRATGRP